MKNQITKLMAFAMLLTASFTASATSTAAERSVKISSKNKKAIVLHLGRLTQGTEISILDQNGQLLFEDTAEEASYTKTFDLESLNTGEVFLEIESADKLEILPIEITATSASIKRTAEVIIEKPVVKMKGENAKVFFGSNGSKTKVTLFDQYGDVAFRETVSDATGSKTYDMTKLESGTYKLHFTTEGRSFYHTIILD